MTPGFACCSLTSLVVHQETIKVGGLAAIKVARIRTILEAVLKERPEHCHGGTYASCLPGARPAH